MTITDELILPQALHLARDQGRRPTCIAFALSELNLRHASFVQLSPEFVYQSAACQTDGWKPGDGVSLGVALQAAAAGQPVETDFPYQAAEPDAPVPAPPSGFDLYGQNIDVVPHDIASMCRMLREGRPIGLGLRLTRSFFSPVDGVIAFEQAALVPEVLHAVTVLGLGREDQESYFLIRNSWGAQWGLGGSAWLSETYLLKHAICAFGG